MDDRELLLTLARRLEPRASQTIRLARDSGQYWWDAPKAFRLHPDTYSDLVHALRTFETRYGHPNVIEMNQTTMGALIDLFEPGAQPDARAASIFGIPFRLDHAMAVGAFRLRVGRFAMMEFRFREATAKPEPKPPTSWDPTPPWQRSYETQWWGTYGNPLPPPTGI
jgi:hypothetical protein